MKDEYYGADYMILRTLVELRTWNEAARVEQCLQGDA